MKVKLSIERYSEVTLVLATCEEVSEHNALSRGLHAKNVP